MAPMLGPDPPDVLGTPPAIPDLNVIGDDFFARQAAEKSAMQAIANGTLASKRCQPDTHRKATRAESACLLHDARYQASLREENKADLAWYAATDRESADDEARDRLSAWESARDRYNSAVQHVWDRAGWIEWSLLVVTGCFWYAYSSRRGWLP
jgi:hypothetical protein